MKLTKIISLITIFSLLVPYLSFAQEFQPPTPITSFFGCETGMTFTQCLVNMANWIFRVILFIAIVLAAIYIILAGLAYVTGGGDPEARKKATARLIYGIIGLVVALLAFVITQVLQSFLSLQRTTF
jgi:hypothetical protein